MSTRFSLSVENEQAYAGRDDPTYLARQMFLADYEQDWQTYPVDSYSAMSADHSLHT